jgi:predicted nucleic acid-binding protein
MILDTTVLVDLQRELRRQEVGPASRLLAELGDTEVAITFVTRMEFAEGYADDQREACERFLAPFQVLWPDEDTAWRAARISRALRARGEAVGDHDAWIAALALQHGRSVVTTNDRHFNRVPSLAVRTY